MKRPRDYNPNYFWIVTVHDWFKTSSANDFRPLRTLNFSNVLDMGILLVKKPKINAALLTSTE